MKQSKSKVFLLFVLAMVCLIVGFIALFIGHTNHLVAGGIALIAFALFFAVFNRAWAALGERGARQTVSATVRGGF
ncbi:hypothetical protein R70006_06282 [Paraburkholderia domus]|uniref:hypothetical protein n=1 Tax=Paraburkholderia domus TaxID=2793075 RepID=UPI001912AC63|nr:hypothetical protein [Paraburkholderia domus]MBK5052913.1 hypothetical protein [Burkholderia sp. R-70006]CAE6822728.1 hypothetical protein R70006_06282 [Paraburkholderia domus]